MLVDRFEVRVSITKLLLALIITIVPLSIVGLVLTARSDKSLDNTVGNSFRALARTYANDVSQYVRDRVSELNAMAADSTVVAAITSSRSSPKQNTAAAGMKGTSGTAAAVTFLKQRRNLDPRFLNITVTDDAGSVVASTLQTPRASYAEDEGWQKVYNKGQGAVGISGILEDEATKSYYLNVGVPVGDPNTGHLIGILTAAVNISPLLQRFQQDQIGSGARAVLVDESGYIVAGLNADVFSRVKSEEFDAIREALGPAQGSHAGWQLADVRSDPFIIGYAATGLKQNFENLGWMVLVSQEEHQVAASIRGLQRFAEVMVILAVFMLTLLCVYYFLHRSQRFEDIENLVQSKQSQQSKAARTGSF